MTLIANLISLLFPRARGWLITFLASVIPATLNLVKDVNDTDKTGLEKYEFVTNEVAELLDEVFDVLPYWEEMEEGARDRIIGGLVEFAYFVVVILGEDMAVNKKALKKALKRL